MLLPQSRNEHLPPRWKIFGCAKGITCCGFIGNPGRPFFGLRQRTPPFRVSHSITGARPSDTKECVVHQPLSNPESQEAIWGEEPWKGESHFPIREKHSTNHVSPEAKASRLGSIPPEVTLGEQAPEANPAGNEPSGESTSISAEPYGRPVSEPQWNAGYGPVRVRQHVKSPPTFLIRPVEITIDDLQDVLTENHGTKRSHSPDGNASGSSKSQRTEEQSGLFAELVSEYGHAESVEVLISSFLQTKLQKELHHSNNPPQIQEQIDASKVTEWTCSEMRSKLCV